MWELSSLTREQTWVPAVEAQSPNHWTTGVSPCFVLFLIKKKKKKVYFVPWPLRPEAGLLVTVQLGEGEV